MKTMINAEINLSEFKGMLKVVHTQRTNEQPHPFCVTGKAIKRYAIDFTVPCGMRVNTDTGAWATKRITKDGITGTCGLSFKEHTYDVQVAIELLQDVPAKKLEDSLSQEGEMKRIFDNFKIKSISWVGKLIHFHILKFCLRGNGRLSN